MDEAVLAVTLFNMFCLILLRSNSFAANSCIIVWEFSIRLSFVPVYSLNVLCYLSFTVVGQILLSRSNAKLHIKCIEGSSICFLEG
jgi:hypothetical protein